MADEGEVSGKTTVQKVKELASLIPLYLEGDALALFRKMEGCSGRRCENKGQAKGG